MPNTFTIPIDAQVAVPDNVDLNDPAVLAKENAKAQKLTADIKKLVEKYFGNQEPVELMAAGAAPQNVIITVQKIDKP